MRLLTSMIVLSGIVMLAAGCNHPAPAAPGEVVLNVPGMR